MKSGLPDRRIANMLSRKERDTISRSRTAPFLEK